MWLCETAAAPEELLAVLSPGERERAARFSDPRRGAAWAGSRALLRSLLGSYSGLPAATLAFRRSPAGKPSLPSGPPFSLAHSGTWALYAFSAEGEVGVDIEAAVPRRRDLAGLALRAFGSEQAERLRELAAEEREREFLRLWTRREARVKCLSDARGPEPWVTELAPGGAAAAALAVRTEPRAVRCFRR